MCAQQGNGNPKHDDDAEKDEQTCIVMQHPEVRNEFFYQQYRAPNCNDGNDGSDEPVHHSPLVDRLGNEPPGGAHHLHGLNKEPVAVHGQANGIINRKDYEDRKYECGN